MKLSKQIATSIIALSIKAQKNSYGVSYHDLFYSPFSIKNQPYNNQYQNTANSSNESNNQKLSTINYYNNDDNRLNSKNSADYSLNQQITTTGGNSINQSNTAEGPASATENLIYSSNIPATTSDSPDNYSITPSSSIQNDMSTPTYSYSDSFVTLTNTSDSNYIIPTDNFNNSSAIDSYNYYNNSAISNGDFNSTTFTSSSENNFPAETGTLSINNSSLIFPQISSSETLFSRIQIRNCPKHTYILFSAIFALIGSLII
jgi:hypothetical protein